MFQRRGHDLQTDAVVQKRTSKSATRYAKTYALKNVVMGKPRRTRAIMLILILLMLCYILNIERIRTHPQEMPTIRRNGIDAIVTIAAKGFGSAMVVSSLVQTGSWDGPIYVLTNGPEKQKDVAAQFNATLVNIGSNHPTFLTKDEREAYKHYFDTVNRDFWVKWHKTQIFKLLPNVTNVLYMDADIMLQKPIHEFLRDSQPAIDQEGCEIWLYPERWYHNIRVKKLRYENTGKYNSGIMVLNRNKSHAILQEWNSTLVKAPFGKRDQPKLAASIEKLGTKVCRLPKRLSHVSFESDFMDRLLNEWWHVRTFRHMVSRKIVQQTWKRVAESTAS